MWTERRTRECLQGHQTTALLQQMQLVVHRTQVWPLRGPRVLLRRSVLLHRHQTASRSLQVRQMTWPRVRQQPEAHWRLARRQTTKQQVL